MASRASSCFTRLFSAGKLLGQTRQLGGNLVHARSFVSALGCSAQLRPRSNVVPASGKFLTIPSSSLPVVSSQSYASGEAGGKLSDFLTEEIKLENENRKHKSPPKIKGFKIDTNGPVIRLTKTHQDEEVSVEFNVNNTVDADGPFDEEKPQQQEDVAPELKSKPVFEVHVRKGNQTLSFMCSFLQSETPNEAEDFEIEELAVHSGEWTDDHFCVAGAVLDGNLYDHLLNYLDERGIGEQFANELVQYSTAYEHSLYIDMLGNLQKFVR